MKIKDLIADWLCETEIFEMAYQRKKAIEIVRNHQRQIAKHIIKYLYYDASLETKKHWVAEINAWLATIDEIKLKNGKKLSGDVYYDLLFNEPLGEVTDISGIIKNIDKFEDMKYFNKIGTLSELHVSCEKLLHTISYDLANDKFEDFSYYATRI